MPVHPATRSLIEAYREAAAIDWDTGQDLTRTILDEGGGADAEVLLPVFLADPAARDGCLPVLAQHGDTRTAAGLVDAFLTGERLDEELPEDILHVVGLLGFEAAESVLWRHVDEPHHYWQSKAACLGLLHLPCRDLGPRIAAALERHFDANLFPEFLPILAAKTGDPSWLPRMRYWGGRDGRASTDCNGGLILGIAMHPNATDTELIELLWDPAWEADGGGTGSELWAYTGTRARRLSLERLFADLVSRSATESDRRTGYHGVSTFVRLLELWLARPWTGVRAADENAGETRAGLCRAVFGGPVTLYDLADRFLSRDDEYLTASILELTETLSTPGDR